jgi:DNA-binding MarR family transcriptional regulator
MKTYHIGLLQAKAYRTLWQYLDNYLKEYQFSPMEWTVLGYVSDAGDTGITNTELSKLFQVETSLMTSMLHKLNDKELILRAGDDRDKRLKIIYITKKGGSCVTTIEKELSLSLTKWLKDVKSEQMRHYVEVLRCLAAKR